MNTMQAAVYHGPNDLRVEEVPVPEIGPDELLLRVLRSNICGTDLRILHGGHRKYPDGTVRIPGHEVVGEVAEVGADVSGYAVGEKLFVAPNMGQGDSRETISGNNNLDPNYDAFGITLDGAFAEYMRVPAQAIEQGNLMPVQEGVDPSVAALIEPFACVWRGQQKVNVQAGDVVVVMGAGPIGVMHIMLANLRGAIRVIVSEPAAGRREQALALGADRAVDPINEDLAAIVLEESNGRGADVVITAAPAKVAQEQAIAIAAVGGRINFFGGLPKDDPVIRLDSNAIHYKELTVTGTTACSTYDCLKAAEIVNSGRIDLAPLITSQYPWSQAVEAFAAAADGQNLRVTLIP
ncbi:MAG: alcohol dehydrogenase catalytic domain-containing protein [Chloroflexota bacterium]